MVKVWRENDEDVIVNSLLNPKVKEFWKRPTFDKVINK